MSYMPMHELPPYEKHSYIRRVLADASLEFFFLSDRVYPYSVHWGPGRTVGHDNDEENCVGCILKWPAKILCYSSIVHNASGVVEVLELPHESTERMHRIVGGCDCLRGTHVRAWRKGGKQGQVMFELRTPFSKLVEHSQTKQLPKPLDIGSVLKRAWELNLKKLRVAHPDKLAEIVFSE